MLTCTFVFLLTIVASFIQRVSGFGFGIFVMMFFPFFLPTYGESEIDQIGVEEALEHISVTECMAED